MDSNQHGDKKMRSKTGKLTVEEVEEIHKAFMETGGHVCRTAQHTGFAKSTVSRYAKKNGWRDELLQNNAEQSSQQARMDSDLILGESTENGDADELIMSKLMTLRGLLLKEIMGGAKSETIDGNPLRILPKTLSEAVKALIDIDKRITDRAETQSITELDAYQNILARCAKIIED